MFFSGTQLLEVGEAMVWQPKPLKGWAAWTRRLKQIINNKITKSINK